MKTKRQIVCAVLGLKQNECSHGDREYVEKFESLYGDLTEGNFRANFDSADFTSWVEESGY